MLRHIFSSPGMMDLLNTRPVVFNININSVGYEDDCDGDCENCEGCAQCDGCEYVVGFEMWKTLKEALSVTILPADFKLYLDNLITKIEKKYNYEG